MTASAAQAHQFGKDTDALLVLILDGGGEGSEPPLADGLVDFCFRWGKRLLPVGDVS